MDLQKEKRCGWGSRDFQSKTSGKGLYPKGMSRL